MGGLPDFLTSALPCALIAGIENVRKRFSGRRLEEIRLRRGKRTELVFSGTSCFLEDELQGTELDNIFYKLCGSSVYAHAESICEGFVRAPGGIRIGVCGRAVASGGKISAVYDISSVNIRLPSLFMPDVRELSDIFVASGGGMLIFSPPGVGKTTVLRALARDLAGRCGVRVGVIDTRGELGFALCDPELRCDVFDGYPKGKGIEIAVRTFSPGALICDEIGSPEEARALLYAAGCGVPIIATVHGDDAKRVALKVGINELHNAGVFDSYVGLERKSGCGSCSWSVSSREAVEELIKNDI